jgi:hypothetical protein
MLDLALQLSLGGVDDHTGPFNEGDLDSVAFALQDQRRCL